MNNNNDLVMYYIVNSDLKMQKGKICSQIGHATVDMLLNINKENKYFNTWLLNGQPKIVLKQTEKNILQLVDKFYKKDNKFFCIKIHDAGKTQIAPNSLTVLAFCPYPKKLIKDILITQAKLL